jgi:hypothetical protein
MSSDFFLSLQNIWEEYRGEETSQAGGNRGMWGGDPSIDPPLAMPFNRNLSRNVEGGSLEALGFKEEDSEHIFRRE